MVVNLLSIRGLEGRLDTRLDKLEEKVQRLEIALANLRAELFEKFQTKSHA
jgi:chaperonin cofactor prefoldin